MKAIGAADRLALGAAASLAAAIAASAQTPRDQIVVTAERRATERGGEALNVSVLGDAELSRIDAEHPQEALNRLPGVFIHRGSGAEHLTAIRSPVLSGGAGAGSFLFLEDGVPLRAAGFANVNGLFESVSELAGAIEVVRGPGPALYGSNAVHGLINVVTPTPQSDRETLTLSTGSFGRARGAFALERGAGERAFGLYGSAAHEDGWRAASGVDRQSVLGRTTWRGAGLTADTAAAFVNLNQETAGFVVGPRAYENPALERTNPNPEAYRDARAARIRSRLDWGGERPLAFAVTPFARWTQMEFLQHFLPGQPVEENGHWSAGALATVYWQAHEDVQVVAGVDLEYSEGHLVETQAAPSFAAFPQGVHYDYAVSAPLVAAYSEIEWGFVPGWALEAGARVETVRYRYDNRAGDGDVGRFRRPADRTDTFTTWTPNVALRRSLGESADLYLRYARGARAPQTTDLYRLQTGQNVGEIAPESIDSFELGARGAWRRVSFDVAAFAMEKENFFFRDADGLNVPDGRTRHRGVEIEGGWAPRRDLTLSGSATYARHTYRFDRPVAANATESISFGDDVDTAPHWLWNARALWSPTQRLEFELEWVHVGRYFTDAANEHDYPGHDLINLRAAARVADGVEIFGAIRNAANIDYAERADFAFDSERYFPGEDRSFTFGIRAFSGS